MSVFKPFITSDVVVSPFKVNKPFFFEGAALLTGSGIDRYIGENIDPSLWTSGSNPTGDITFQDKYLVYRSIRELYYSNYLKNPNGSPASLPSFQSTDFVPNLSTAINLDALTGERDTTNYYNYLSNTLLANRYFPTGANETVGIISIPSNLFGEYIKPGTFSLSYESGSFNDDGEGNLNTGSYKIGDIIYEHGLIIITSGSPSFITSSFISCSFQSTITIYESQYKCTIRENEFNFSQNPTLISGSSNSGIIYDFATGSYFNPYVTTIGLYNNNKELLAVAKLAQPLPLSAVTDMNILVNLDL